ncbi:lysophospholipid acyltransferase family protein [Marinibactrum halimedae]|uniref:Lipid A biosynthesis lauroyl acyltransferase n=1 Tax=Marinibactrum halimedae TaxID=1444977 RepID=A0AA37TFQ3_9GAMM|nr:lysophospholipid acyltransferase family protein [Marinibactrum halimedae]MCD9460035.1 lysophospholipid acyltransferase family protein [Marinibactrum halimedae]GLS28197.1 lipid A biosynthesis lauroyl acyltransferase [Marinibactrum halimedae]
MKEKNKPQETLDDTNAQKSWKGRIGRLFFYGFAGLPFRLNRWVGRWIGLCLWITRSGVAKVTEENIGYAFPEKSKKERKQLAKLSVIHTAQTFTEMGPVWLRSPKWVQSRILSVTNESLLKEKLATGKGVIILAPHMGNWEVLGHYLSSLSKDITCLYQPAPLPEIDRLIKKARLRVNKLAPTNRKGVSILLKVLRNGEMVGILPDQLPIDGNGEYAKFFNKRALTMTLVRQLQAKTQSQVVAAFAKRVPGGFHVVIADVDSKLYSDDKAEAIEGLNYTVEQCARAVPEQYQWEYKRYRRPPEGEPKPYQYKT